MEFVPEHIMDIFDISVNKLLAAITAVNVGTIIYEMFSCTGFPSNWLYVASHDSLMIIKYVEHLKRTIPNWKFNFYRDVVNAALEAPWPVVVYLLGVEGLHFTLLRDYLPQPAYCLAEK